MQPKINFFAWEATWGKALTLNLVQKRGWALANRCFMGDTLFFVQGVLGASIVCQRDYY